MKYADWKNPHLYLMLAADAILLVLAHFLAYQTRFEFTLTSVEWHQFQVAVIWLVPLKIYVYFRFGLYRGMWRYTNGRDIRRLVEANLIGLLMAAAMLFLVHRWTSFSRAVFILDALFSFLFLALLRLGIRYQHFRKAFVATDFKQIIQGGHRKSVLLFAPPDLNPDALLPLSNARQFSYNILGVVLDADEWKGPLFHNLPVLGLRDELVMALDAHEAHEVFVALAPAANQTTENQARSARSLAMVRTLCQERNIPCRMLHHVVPVLHARNQPPLRGEEM